MMTDVGIRERAGAAVQLTWSGRGFPGLGARLCSSLASIADRSSSSGSKPSPRGLRGIFRWPKAGLAQGDTPDGPPSGSGPSRSSWLRAASITPRRRAVVPRWPRSADHVTSAGALALDDAWIFTQLAHEALASGLVGFLFESWCLSSVMAWLWPAPCVEILLRESRIRCRSYGGPKTGFRRRQETGNLR
jgi:hypothetical protein